mgnify:CR=1 FL=1
MYTMIKIKKVIQHDQTNRANPPSGYIVKSTTLIITKRIEGIINPTIYLSHSSNPILK